MEKLIIFDLDGTVIDTIEDITDAMNKMLVANNFKTITYDAMKKKVGGSSRDIVRLAIDEKISEERLIACEREYTNYYIDGKSPKTRPFNGIKEVFGILKSRGYKIAAISNKPDYEIDALSESVIKPLGFDAVMGLCDQFEPKPNPNGLITLSLKASIS